MLPLSEIAKAEGEKRSVTALQWTADGQQLRAVLTDGSVLTWDGSPSRSRITAVLSLARKNGRGISPTHLAERE